MQMKMEIHFVDLEVVVAVVVNVLAAVQLIVIKIN